MENTPGPDRPPPLRVDAERNRDRILRAARTVFDRDGLGASMTAVAHEAAVGIATLYRRFPTREDLVAAVYAEWLDAYRHAAEAGLADPDPWHGFASCLEKLFALQAESHGQSDVLTMRFPAARGLEQRRDAAYHAVVALVERARTAGRLRPEVTAEDVALLLLANAGLLAATRHAAPDAWLRVLGHLLRGLSADTAVDLPPLPSTTAIYQAMLDGSYRSDQSQQAVRAEPPAGPPPAPSTESTTAST